MTTEPKGRDLFIVDNSVSGWTGLRYLEEWTSIARVLANTTAATVGYEAELWQLPTPYAGATACRPQVMPTTLWCST